MTDTQRPIPAPQNPTKTALLAQCRAPAKIILFGEHFALYGVAAIAAPLFALETRVSLQAGPAGSGPLILAVPPWQDAAERLFGAALKQLGITHEPDWRISVSSSIPSGWGLGSSAAFSVALAGVLLQAASNEAESAALSQQAPRPIDCAPESRHSPAREQGAQRSDAGGTTTMGDNTSRCEGEQREGRNQSVAALAHHLETLTHGRASGIDAAVVAQRIPLCLTPQRRCVPVAVARPLYLALGGIQPEGTTRDAVERVSASAKADPRGFERLCEAAGRVSAAALVACRKGNLQRLGALLDEGHTLLQRINVSHPALDRLVGQARQRGALGAKLTGAGLGGFVSALARSPDEAQALAAGMASAGAQRTLVATIEAC